MQVYNSLLGVTFDCCLLLHGTCIVTNGGRRPEDRDFDGRDLGYISLDGVSKLSAWILLDSSSTYVRI